MRWMTLLLCLGCVHAAAPETAVASAPSRSPADVAFQAAMDELASARYQAAGPLFHAFAETYPQDPRAATARLQEAFAALSSLDEVQGLDQAQAILAKLPPETDPAALRELRTLILTRAQALQAQAAVGGVLSECQGAMGQAVEKERSQSKAQIAKLQAELARKEKTLEQVKQRLLEIQQLSTEMLGAPLPGALAGPPPGSADQAASPQ